MQNNNKTPIPKLINNKFLETDFDKKNDKNANLFVTIILNRPQNLETLIKLNKITDILICADGGANRLYELETTRESLIPKAIVGDLDSLSEKVKNFYEHKGTYIKKYEGQDDTDLEKSINYLFENDFLGFGTYKNIQVTITGAFGGRLD